MRKSSLPSRLRWLPLTIMLINLPVAVAQTTSPPGNSAPVAGPALTLQQALDYLSGSPSVKQSQLSVQAAQATFNAARTALGLTVAATGGANYVGPYSTTVAGNNVNVDSSLSGSAGVNVSLGVFPWSSSQAGLRRSQWALAYAQARLIAAQNTAKLNVMQQYFNGLLATQDVQLADQALAVAQRQLAVVQAQQGNGNATQQSVLAAQASVQSAQAQQLQAAASVQQARLSLAGALGQTLGDVQFVTSPDETLTLPDVEKLVAQARTVHSDVIYAQQQLSNAQDALSAAQIAANIPDVTASVTYGPNAGTGLGASLNLQQGTVGASYRQPFPNNSDTTSHLIASVSGTYVIYSPALRAEVSSAQASVLQSQVSLSVAQQTVELQVRTAYSTLQNALNGVQTQLAQVKVAQASLEAAQASLKAGTGTQDAVNSAQLSLAQAQRALLSARVGAQLALLQLMIASGGLS